MDEIATKVVRCRGKGKESLAFSRIRATHVCSNTNCHPKLQFIFDPHKIECLQCHDCINYAVFFIRTRI